MMKRCSEMAKGKLGKKEEKGGWIAGARVDLGDRLIDLGVNF